MSNSQPTICINDVIRQHNCERGLNLKPLTTSELLARTVSAIEDCVTQFQDKGHEDFCQLYYKYWLHRYRKTSLCVFLLSLLSIVTFLFLLLLMQIELAVLLETEMRE